MDFSTIDLKNMTPGVIIRIIMFIILFSGLITLFVNTDKINKDSNAKKYYGSNVASSVLITIFVLYNVLYDNKYIPE
jgi:hypothetical protein